MCLPIFQFIECVVDYFFDKEDISEEEEPVSYEPVSYEPVSYDDNSTSTEKTVSTGSSRPKPSVPSKLVTLLQFLYQ